MDTQKLKNYLSRISQIESEKAELNRDIKQIYNEAELDGIPVITLKQAVKLSKMKRREREALEEVADILD